MTLRKLDAAKAIHSMLSPFHAMTGQTLRTVQYRDEEGSRTQITLGFDSGSLKIQANENDDSIEVTVVPCGSVNDLTDAGSLEPWTTFIGKTLGWGWLAFNQQGYCDGVLLSFDGGVLPQVVLTVAASSIKVGSVRL